LNVLKGSQFQNRGIDTLVLAVTSHTFCLNVACAKVGQTSGITLSHADHPSHMMYFSISEIASGDCDNNMLLSNCDLFTASVEFTATGTIGLDENVFTHAIVSFHVSWTTLASSALSVSSLATSSCMSFTCSAVVTRETASPTSKLNAVLVCVVAVLVAGQYHALLTIVNVSPLLLVTFTISLLVTGLFSRVLHESYFSIFNRYG